jgi:hypothetical protein
MGFWKPPLSRAYPGRQTKPLPPDELASWRAQGVLAAGLLAKAVPCHHLTKRAALQVSSAFPFALQHSWKTTACQPSSFTTRAGFLCLPAFAESLD